MSRISYCSIEEAWGQDFANRYNAEHGINYIGNQFANDNLKPILVKKNNISNNYKKEENDKEHNYEEELYNNKIPNAYSNSQNYSVISKKKLIKKLENKIEWLNNECNRCKAHLGNISKKKHISKKKYKQMHNLEEFIEKFTNSDSVELFNNNGLIDNSYLDLVIFIILGLIVIFGMDTILRLGKKIGMRNNS